MELFPLSIHTLLVMEMIVVVEVSTGLMQSSVHSSLLSSHPLTLNISASKNGFCDESDPNTLPSKLPVEELECRQWQHVQMEDGRDE